MWGNSASIMDVSSAWLEEHLRFGNLVMLVMCKERGEEI